MGTSSSRSGSPSRGGSAWASAKRRVTSFTRDTGSSVGSAVSGFASAFSSQGGGYRKESARGTSGGGTRGKVAVVRAGQALGSFISEVGSVGLDETLRRHGLENVIGQQPAQVLNAIADHLCADGGPLDDAVSRSAVVEVLAEIFDDNEDSYADLRDRWDETLDAAALQDLMSMFLIQSIFQRFLSEFADRIESNVMSGEAAERKEKEVFDFIKEMVKFELEDIDVSSFDWRGKEGKELIERNINTALSLLEEQ